MTNILNSLEFYDYVEYLRGATSVAHVQSVCAEFLGQFGGRYFKYKWVPPKLIRQSESISFANCPDQWMKRYTEEGYDKDDPKMRYCNTRSRPVCWSDGLINDLIRDPKLAGRDRAFWQDTLDQGLGHGVTIPIQTSIGGNGLLCVAYDEANAGEGFASLPLLEAWAMHMHSHLQTLYRRQQIGSPLSERELEVLRWTVIGKTTEEVGRILNISDNTVLFHLKGLRRKLNVSNKFHLTAQALALGLVEM